VQLLIDGRSKFVPTLLII